MTSKGESVDNHSHHIFENLVLETEEDIRDLGLKIYLKGEHPRCESLLFVLSDAHGSPFWTSLLPRLLAQVQDEG